MMDSCNKRIVLIVKASDIGEKALQKAVSIMKENNCDELSLLFVADMDFFSGNSSGYVKPDYLVEKGLEGIGRAVLDNMEKTAQEIDKNIKTERIVLNGNTAEEILRFVKENKVDILIIPKDERGPIEKFLTGGDIGEFIDEIEKYTKVITVE